MVNPRKITEIKTTEIVASSSVHPESFLITDILEFLCIAITDSKSGLLHRY